MRVPLSFNWLNYKFPRAITSIDIPKGENKNIG